VIERVEDLTGRVAAVDEAVSQQSTGTCRIRASAQSLRTGAAETEQVLADFARSAGTLREAVGSLREVVGRFRLS
jgi:methyl-accepting chemotaxis protein